MKKFRIGRLDRLHYWVCLLALMAAKVSLGRLLGNYASGGGTAIDVFVICAVIARFHDFDLPTWPAVTLCLALGLVLPVGLIIATGNTSDAMRGAAVLPLLLTLFAIGLIPGIGEANAYGPPGQGFNGLQRRDEVAPPPSVQSRRIAAISGRV